MTAPLRDAGGRIASPGGLLPVRARGFLVAYVVGGAAFIVLDAVDASLWLRLAVKTLLMPLLAVVLWAGTQGTWLRSTGRTGVVALVFSAVGDALLELPGKAWFAAGIGGFLVAQACYVLAFRRPPGRGPVSRRPLLLVPFVAFFLGMNLLLTEAGPLRVPVLVYSAVIVAMAAAALDLRGRIEGTAAAAVFAGALVFVASDSMIALGTFTTWGSFPGRGTLVMLTYLVGQALITLGLCRGARLGPPGS